MDSETMERLQDERRIIAKGLVEPAVQLIFRKLDKAADDMLLMYDKQDFINKPEKAIYIQCFRDIVKREIPQIFENIIHTGQAEQHKPWGFRQWLWSKIDNILARLHKNR